LFLVDYKSAGVYIGAAEYHGIQLAPAFIDLHGPRRTPLCVTWGQMRRQFGAPELDRVSVMQQAIHFRGGTALPRAFGRSNIGVHDHWPRPGLFFNDADGCIMIVMCVTG